MEQCSGAVHQDLHSGEQQPGGGPGEPAGGGHLRHWHLHAQEDPHLCLKIQESVLMDLFQRFHQELDTLEIEMVQKETFTSGR